MELVNHLGIALGNSPEEILTRLQEGDFAPDDVETSNKKSSDTEYRQRVRDVDAATPARFNADKRRLYEASGCAGKLAVFAVRLDTYPINDREKVFYIGTNDPDELAEIRRHILSSFETLPVSAEYMHRDIFDIARDYGKDTVLMINHLGTDHLPKFFALKGTLDAWFSKVPFMPDNFVDHAMQIISRCWPNILPVKMLDYRNRFEHHLILKMRDDGIKEAAKFLQIYFAGKSGEFFECTEKQANLAELHRFAAAGAAVRYQAVHRDDVEEILALDIALKRNERDWFEKLPSEIDEQIVHKLYYGHFMCHVLHQDYIVKKGANAEALKNKMLDLLDQRGAEYPAEHNVGHLYEAKSDLAGFYEQLDLTNTFNPGIGKTAGNRQKPASRDVA